MRLQLLEEDVGRDLATNVGHEKDRQRSVKFGTRLEVQIPLESQNGHIADINPVRRIPSQIELRGCCERLAICLPVQEREQVQYTQARQQMQVNLGHQFALTNWLKLRRFRVRLRVIVLLVAILGSLQLCRWNRRFVSVGLYEAQVSRANRSMRRTYIGFRKK